MSLGRRSESRLINLVCETIPVLQGYLPKLQFETAIDSNSKMIILRGKSQRMKDKN